MEEMTKRESVAIRTSSLLGEAQVLVVKAEIEELVGNGSFFNGSRE